MDEKGLVAQVGEEMKDTEGIYLATHKTYDTSVEDWVDTQTPTLNAAMGTPGIPVGRITTIIGLEASGKSTLALHLLAATQQLGGIAVLANSEQRYDRQRAKRIGIDHSRLIVLKYPTLERMIQAIYKIIRTAREEWPDRLVTIVYDSVAGSPTEAEITGEGEDQPAKHAKFLSQEMRKLHPLVVREQIAMVFVNQLRHKIDFSGWGRPQMVMLGEKALTYWAAVKILLTQVGKVGEGKKPTGIQVDAFIAKNQVADPYRHAEFNIDFRTGIDTVGSALDLAAEAGLVKQRGSWYEYEGKKFRRADFGKLLEKDEGLRLMIAQIPILWREGDAEDEEDEEEDE